LTDTSVTLSLPLARRNLAYASLVLLILMTNLDTSIVNVALHQLSRTLQAETGATVWVTTTYLLAVGCAVPATAALGDQVGRRRLLLAGVPTFTLASLACALSTTLPMLVAFRALQGMGAAMVFAVTIPIMRMIFPESRLGSVFGINAMATALGVCAGPTLGGLVLAHLSWPWLFLINVPIGVVAFAAAVVGVPQHQGVRGNFDWLGAASSAGAIAAFLVGVHEFSVAVGAHDSVDVARLRTGGGLLVVAALLVVVLVHCEKSATRPVLPLPMWRNSVFSLSVTTAFWSFFGQGAAFVALPLLFQSAYAATALRAAMLFTPWPAVIVLVSPIVGRLADRVRPAGLAVSGLAVYVLGLLALALLGDHPATWMVLASTALAGLGFALFQSPNNREMQGAVPIELASSGAAVLNLNRSVAQSAGSAMVSIALALSGAGVGFTLQEARAATSVLWVAVAGALLSLALSAAKLRTVVLQSRAE